MDDEKEKSELLNKQVLNLINANNKVKEENIIKEEKKIVVETELPKVIKQEQKQENKENLEVLMRETNNEKVEYEYKTRKENKFFLILCIGFGILFVVVLVVALFAKEKIFSFSGNQVYYQNQTNENIGEYQTVIVTDNIYTGVSIKNEDDAKELIVKDSNNQKSKCTNEEIKKIEINIENNYGIIASNLCEMDVSFAREVESAIGTIYKEFPKIKGYLTNLTLINTPYNYIASFVSAKVFAKSNTSSTYPNVYKMSIFLNTSYFLNPIYFEKSIEDCLTYGYFPPNATKTSIVAHEFGHYLSFIAQLNNTNDIDKVLLLTKENRNAYYNLIDDSNNGVFSKKIIDEAFNNYKKKYSEYNTVLSFKNSISEYAIEKNYETGEYIYDETIAEAFHDYYINRNNASVASKEIMSVLKKYLNK